MGGSAAPAGAVNQITLIPVAVRFALATGYPPWRLRRLTTCGRMLSIPTGQPAAVRRREYVLLPDVVGRASGGEQVRE
jgi:hypothetical protein